MCKVSYWVGQLTCTDNQQFMVSSGYHLLSSCTVENQTLRSHVHSTHNQSVSGQRAVQGNWWHLYLPEQAEQSLILTFRSG